jgi:hypothetical protein
MKKQNNFIKNFKTTVLLTALLVMVVQLKAQVSIWHFDDNVTATPTTYNGTAVGSPTYTTGKVGTALTLSGTGQYATAPFVLNPTSAFTITAWVKYTGSRTGLLVSPTIVQQGDGSGTGRGWLLLDRLTLKLGSYIGNIATNSTTIIANDTWYMLSVTYTGNSSTKTLKIYVNGVQENSAIVTAESSVGSMFIGSHKSAGTNVWTGSIDELAIYNTVLSAADLLQMYNNVSTSIHQNSKISNKIYSINKKIIVEDVRSQVSVLDLNGRYIQSNKIAGTFTSKHLTPGMYFVNVDGVVSKMAVR